MIIKYNKVKLNNSFHNDNNNNISLIIFDL